ncbi:MAG: thiamine pyrophosphokinae, catalytic region [Ilumatobacteraceae bacterium]|nr:thiamine pyrophosphokinae, catalytic region [Ilumatobacteraceae bacterium]
MAARSDIVVTARARADSRTKDLVKRLEPGEIAVINHSDVDLVAADALIDAGVVAVINATSSFTGRYPNLGPLQIVRSGAVLVDDVGIGVLERVAEGEVVTIDGDRVMIGTDVIAEGRRQTEDDLVERVAVARNNVGEQLELFAANTLEYLRRERHLATDQPDLPPSIVEFKNRQTLIVVRGMDFREDLRALHRSGYVREMRPVLIGVDGGADAMLELGLKPHIIIGDMDSVSESALKCGAELIVHAYSGGRAPGAERLRDLGLQHMLFESPGTSEDIAMLLAYERGTELIVAVGTHNTMEDFLDKGRQGMASTFLVRLKIGRILVDAKGVNNLYRPVVKGRDIALFAVAMLSSLVLVVAVSEPIRLWFRSLWLWMRARFGW